MAMKICINKKLVYQKNGCENYSKSIIFLVYFELIHSCDSFFFLNFILNLFLNKLKNVIRIATGLEIDPRSWTERELINRIS